MTAQKTIEYFSYYLLVLGACLVFAPALMAAIILLPPPADNNILFVGFLVLALAYYYWRMARDTNTAFFQATVIGRLGLFLATLIWVVFAGLAANYLVILAIDAAGALWTANALKGQGDAGFKFF